jgi:hypothetical protein
MSASLPSTVPKNAPSQHRSRPHAHPFDATFHPTHGSQSTSLRIPGPSESSSGKKSVLYRAKTLDPAVASLGSWPLSRRAQSAPRGSPTRVLGNRDGTSLTPARRLDAAIRLRSDADRSAVGLSAAGRVRSVSLRSVSVRSVSVRTCGPCSCGLWRALQRLVSWSSIQAVRRPIPLRRNGQPAGMTSPPAAQACELPRNCLNVFPRVSSPSFGSPFQGSLYADVPRSSRLNPGNSRAGPGPRTRYP